MGLGYIGLPTAIIAAKHGVEVVGVDVNKDVVEVTNAGKLHIVEDGLEALLKEAIASGDFKAYTQPSAKSVKVPFVIESPIVTSLIIFFNKSYLIGVH